MKGGYKDFDILSVATEEPVIAEPYICGGIPLDESFFALVLMSDGVYRSIEEAADIETNSNFEVVRLVVEELQCQNNLTGVAQAVVDRIGRLHHDTYMIQLRKCQKRDDMTILIRIFKEEIANSMKSPRATVRQSATGIPPVSPGVIPVSVPFNPANPISGGAPSLYIPHSAQPRPQPGNTPSPTTSTPTNVPAPSFTVTSSRSDTQSSASSASESPTMNIMEPGVAQEQSASVSSDEAGEGGGESRKDGEETRVQPYVDFTDFYRQVAEYGEEYVYGWDKEKTEAAA